MGQGRHFKRGPFILLMAPVQELDPVDRQGDGGEIFFYFSSDQVRPHLVQHVTEPVVGLREEDGFVMPRGVL
jgi:hypothetical protein